MKLAKAVVRDDGITLVGDGVELTESLIARFEQAGIGSITVKGNPVQMDDLPGGTDYSRRAARLDHLFRKHTDNTFMMTLKKVLNQYFKIKSAAIAAAAAAEAQAEADAAEAAAGANTNEVEGTGAGVSPGGGKAAVPDGNDKKAVAPKNGMLSGMLPKKGKA